MRSAPPPPPATLADARAVLRRYFGFPDFRPPQRRAVEAVIRGRDALLLLPTGGGKSLCYQVPALLRPGLTVVVSPLISLMQDQVEALGRRQIGAGLLNSTRSPREVADCLASARDGALRLLYLAPERLIAGRTLDHLAAIGVALFAVDEAHCISEWGHDFRPAYRRLGALRHSLGNPQTVALTATATPEVRRDIVDQLALRDAITVVAGFDRDNLTFGVVPTRTLRDKDQATVEWLRRTPGPAIVYAPTRHAVERTTVLLNRARLSVAAYHGGLDDRHRHRTQEAFMEQRARVIVATSAFGMGIDKPDVRLVLHHALPGSLEAYYQEAGRAGRDSAPGRCVLLYGPQDRRTHEYFIDHLHPPAPVVARVWEALRSGRGADGAGQTVGQLAAQLRPAVARPLLLAALRTLMAAGACVAEPHGGNALWVRLLASPERIRRELVGDQGPQREVLRHLWRAAGGHLTTGTLVDPARLVPGRAARRDVVALLRKLADRQFVLIAQDATGYRIDAHGRGARRVPVDWEALARRRRRDLGRLDAMQGYARTSHCRRAYLLRYFGDTAVRATCGACDRCLGDTTGHAPPTPRTLP